MMGKKPRSKPSGSGHKVPPPLLWAFIQMVFIPLEAAGKSANYRSSIRRSVKLLEAILDRAATLSDLTTTNLKAVQYAETGAAVGLGVASRHTLRKRLRAVWKYAATLGYLDPPPRDRTRKAKAARESKRSVATVRTPPEPGTLLADVEAMIMETSVCDGTADQYRVAIRCYGRFLGRHATREDLDELTVNRWLRSLEGQIGPTTIHGRKRGLTPVWNWLAGQNLVEYYNPRRLRRTRQVIGPVKAWSLENVQALLAGVAELQGEMRFGIAAADFMRAVVLVAFETGLRPGDIRRLRGESIDVDACVIELVQNKTTQRHRAAISDVTADALRKIDFAGRPRVFPLSKKGLQRWLDRLYAAAEPHGFKRAKGQSLGTLRKSHATERARSEGVEAASRSLGHVSGTGIALRHYIAADAIKPLGALACMSTLEKNGRFLGSDRTED